MRQYYLYLMLMFLYANTSFANAYAGKRIDFFQLIISEQHKNLHSFKNHLGCPNTTVGNYLGLLLANGTGGEIHNITFKCDFNTRNLPFNPTGTLAKTHSYCRIGAYSSDQKGVSPWHYALIFLVNKKTHKLNSDNIYCPGAG